ncbi:MAG: hypothetical protein JO232_04560 [Verrucomicrobia bacterium]|nr:hypothetical protein [Verrucomicrobiota bacterium]
MIDNPDMSGPTPTAPKPASDVEPDPLLRSDLRDHINEAVQHHNPTFDGALFNGGTILQLVLTAAASFLPGSNWIPNAPFLAGICAALAALLITVERSLSFGARWRFHTEMQTGYRSILDMIDFYQCITADDEKAKYRANIWNALYALRSREGGIPGGATSTTSTAGGA